MIRTCTTGEIAGFLAETILGSGGFIVPPPGYFEQAVAIARKYGGLFIADEVQTAWGRTGDKWFGIEHWNVEPDMITSAKGMGNGAPVAVTIATPEVADKYPGIDVCHLRRQPGLDGRGPGHVASDRRRRSEDQRPSRRRLPAQPSSSSCKKSIRW